LSFVASQEELKMSFFLVKFSQEMPAGEVNHN
jgi:hypothetical protein